MEIRCEWGSKIDLKCIWAYINIKLIRCYQRNVCELKIYPELVVRDFDCAKTNIDINQRTGKMKSIQLHIKSIWFIYGYHSDVLTLPHHSLSYLQLYHFFPFQIPPVLNKNNINTHNKVDFSTSKSLVQREASWNVTI